MLYRLSRQGSPLVNRQICKCRLSLHIKHKIFGVCQFMDYPELVLDFYFLWTNNLQHILLHASTGVNKSLTWKVFPPFYCFSKDMNTLQWLNWLKNSPANAGDSRDMGSIPGLGRSSGEGNGNPLQYSCLGNPMDRRGRQATVHGVPKSWTWLSVQAHTHIHTHTLET